MIQSAVLKLTFYYLSLIVMLSICFSIAVYQITGRELNHGYRRPTSSISFSDGSVMTFEEYRDTNIIASEKALRRNLVVFNIVTLVLGGIVSYLLARQTLTPIEEAMEAQARFTADASHELRTPLTSMQSQIEVTLRDPKLKLKEAKDTLVSNLEEVGKLNTLATSLLRLARNNGQAPPMSPVSLKSTSADAVERLSSAAKTKNIKLDNQVKNLKVLGYEPSITELAIILIDNAIKYSPEDTTVTISSKNKGKQRQFIVQDQGVGVSEADAKQIFERFYRADHSRSKQKIDGYGLGLAIAVQIVKTHHGNIHLDSALGKGSTFTVSLPAA